MCTSAYVKREKKLYETIWISRISFTNSNKLPALRESRLVETEEYKTFGCGVRKR